MNPKQVYRQHNPQTRGTMPETRAAKRVKTNHGSSPAAKPESYLSSHEAHLQALNSLSSSDFRAYYIPSDRLIFSPKKTTHHVNEHYELEYYDVCELGRKELDRCFRLIEQTSRHDYEPSSRGWHPRSKRAEMRERKMRYLIVRRDNTVHKSPASDFSGEGSGPSSPTCSTSQTSEAVDAHYEHKDLDTFGFLSFQLDEDWIANSTNPIPILYIYEIHLGKRLRSTGLGAHLMECAKHIAIATRMHKVELSVFTSNTGAERFYRRLGYDVDETSPETVVKGRQSVPTDWLVMSTDLRPIIRRQ